MFPAFNIFLYILSDHLMPWLNENQDEKKFKLLIDKMGDAFLAKSQIFFKELIVAYKKLNINIPEKIIKEFILLSNYNEIDEAGDIYKYIFDLPAINFKQKFYNILITQSIKSYYSICYNLLKYNISIDFKKYYFNKLIDFVNKILCTSIIKIEKLSDEDLEIIRKIQIVLCVLIFKLRNDFNKNIINDIVFKLKTIIDEDSNIVLKNKLQNIFDSLFNEKINDEPKQEMPPNNKENKNKFISEYFSNTDKITINDLINKNDIDDDFSEIIKNYTGNIKNDNKDEEIIKSSEVIKILQISKSTLYRLRKEEKIKYFKVGSRYKYYKKDIENFKNRS